ncbi:MAG: GNAT family N-acetyltransferase [Microbacterium sp.]
MTTDTEVVRNDAQSRYEIRASDGSGQTTLCGFAEFTIEQDRIRFTGTETDPAFRGRGLGTILAAEALADAVRQGLTIVPQCPFIARHLRENDVPGAEVDWPRER